MINIKNYSPQELLRIQSLNKGRHIFTLPFSGSDVFEYDACILEIKDEMIKYKTFKYGIKTSTIDKFKDTYCLSSTDTQNKKVIM